MSSIQALLCVLSPEELPEVTSNKELIFPPDSSMIKDASLIMIREKNAKHGLVRVSHEILNFPVKPRYCRSVLIHCRASWICSKFLSKPQQFLPKPRQIFQKLFVAALAKIVVALTKFYYISIQFLKKVRQISGFYRESTLLGMGFSFHHAQQRTKSCNNP